MSDFQARFQALLKNKKVLYPAVAIGGIAGVYVLYTSSKHGASSLTPAKTTDPATTPAAGGSGSGSSGGDGGAAALAGIESELAQQQLSNQSTFASFAKQLSDLASGFASSLNSQQAQNQSALQSLADQTNQALAAQAQNGFSGFQSQLASTLQQAVPVFQPQQFTGKVQQFLTPTSKPPLTGSFSPLPAVVGTARVSLQDANQVAFNFGSLVRGIVRTSYRNTVTPNFFNRTITHVNALYPTPTPKITAIKPALIGGLNKQYGRPH